MAVTPVPTEQAREYAVKPRQSNPYRNDYDEVIKPIINKGPHVIDGIPSDEEDLHKSAIYGAARRAGCKAYIKRHKEKANTLVVSVFPVGE